MEGVTTFSISASWDASAREGRLANADGSFAAAHTGAPALDGKGGTANPEELLLAAVTACFLQTWAIFVEKLKLPIASPRLDATCALEKDPAGGYKVTRIDLHPHVPAALLQERRTDVEKTLSLAEKYCIVSKAVRGSVTLAVAAKAV
jgi:organic hydroperoxide reductase OsmC/OhrA